LTNRGKVQWKHPITWMELILLSVDHVGRSDVSDIRSKMKQHSPYWFNWFSVPSWRLKEDCVLHHHTQLVCIFVGCVNRTKSYNQLYAPYCIHFGFRCLNVRPNNTTNTCSLAIMFTSVTNKNKRQKIKLHDQLKIHNQPHDHFFQLFLPRRINTMTNFFGC
jgi:hypothetical protein